MSETNKTDTPDYKDSAEVALMLEREIDRRVAYALMRLLDPYQNTPQAITHFDMLDNNGVGFELTNMLAQKLGQNQYMLQAVTQRMQLEMRQNFNTLMPDIRITYKGNTAPW